MNAESSYPAHESCQASIEQQALNSKTHVDENKNPPKKLEICN